MKDRHHFVLNALAVSMVLSVMLSCSSPSGKRPAYDTVAAEKKETTHFITIAQMNFSPAEITVSKGDTLVFINHDLVAHNVTEEDSNAWASPVLQPGQQWEHIVTASANYYCTIHPVMKGKITAQ